MASGEDRIHDLLIVGAGPAGVSCALQAARDGLDLVLVGDEPVGGLLPAARRIENLAGLPGVAGRELAGRLARQLADRGVVVRRGRVVALRRADGLFRGALADGTRLAARTVCLATGTRPRPWPPGEGRKVPRDARDWPDDLRGRRAVVVGGGEAAFDTALTARDRGACVLVLVRGPAPRAGGGLLEEARRRGVEWRGGVEVTALRGAPGAWEVETADGSRIETDEFAACVGREPRRELLDDLGAPGLPASVESAEVPGLFGAGDLIRGRERYVATALGDGQRAAIAAREFLGGCASANGAPNGRKTARAFVAGRVWRWRSCGCPGFRGSRKSACCASAAMTATVWRPSTGWHRPSRVARSGS